MVAAYFFGAENDPQLSLWPAVHKDLTSSPPEPNRCEMFPLRLPDYHDVQMVCLCLESIKLERHEVQPTRTRWRTAPPRRGRIHAVPVDSVDQEPCPPLRASQKARSFRVEGLLTGSGRQPG